ncbi:MAG: hypothetical protein WC548_04320 [Candidatus Pacearchaeota archaeon]
MKKKGSEKYYILTSLILGILVLAISLYFIFNEYFNQDEIDWETCRQSVYLRSISPDFHKITDLKDAIPLKCKTQVIEIDTAKPDEIYKKISDTIASGWYLFGEGKFDIVPRNILKSKNYCMVFARVHFTQKSIDNLDKNLGMETEVLKKILNPPNADAVTGMNYQPYLEPLKKYIEFNTNFFKYYINTKIKNSQKTYNNYLPLLSSSIETDYVLFKTEISPSKNDLLFVYRIPKTSAARESIIGNIVTGIGIGSIGIVAFPISVPVAIAGGIGLSIIADKNVFNFEDLWNKISDKKAIIIISQSDINSIGCDEFLTIPA